MSKVLSLFMYLFKSNVYNYQNVYFFNLIKFKEIKTVEFCDVCECSPCDCDWGN